MRQPSLFNQRQDVARVPASVITGQWWHVPRIPGVLDRCEQHEHDQSRPLQAGPGAAFLRVRVHAATFGDSAAKRQGQDGNERAEPAEEQRPQGDALP